MITGTESLARLLQLASPTLPVGAFSYSGGLEAAVQARVVVDEASAGRWIGDVLDHSVAGMEAPILVRMLRAPDRIAEWNDTFVAGRETAELRAETLQTGYSLRRLLSDLDVAMPVMEETSYPAAFACAAIAWSVEPRAALIAYLWAWLENQVMAAVKAVPLGQTAAQRLLRAHGARLDALATRTLEMRDDALGNFAPGLAVLSSRHETQYSRLFRS